MALGILGIVSFMLVIAGAALEIYARQGASCSQPPAMPLPPDEPAPDLRLPDPTPDIQEPQR